MTDQLRNAVLSLPWFPTGVAIHDGSIYVLEFTDTGTSAGVRKLAGTG